MLRSLIFVVLAHTAMAQSTWNDLRFKTSEADAKTQMASRGFELHPVQGEEGHFTATPDYDLALSDLIITLPFKVDLNFGPSGLTIITLTLDVPKLLADNPKHDLGAIAITTITAQKIHDALVTKYGAPLEQSGPCNKVEVTTLLGERGIVDCHTKWRGEAQLVSVYWAYWRDQKKLAYFVQYQAQANGL